MTKILCMGGRKTSGKSSAANFVFGLAARSLGCTKDFAIGPDGKLNVIHDESGDWVNFDPLDRRPEVQDWLADNIWPMIRLYSFADPLKEFCVEVLGLSEKQCWGSEEDKNGLTHIIWENMPGFTGTFKGERRTGYMTAREVLQYVGTDIFRKMDPDCWVRTTLSRIEADGSAYAVITDCRFPNESAGVRKVGGIVLNFTRKLSDDQHASERGLDDDLNVSFHFDNQDLTLEEKNDQLFSFLVDIGWAQDTQTEGEENVSEIEELVPTEAEVAGGDPTNISVSE